MWARFKALPMFLKVICGGFLFLTACVLVLQMLHIGPDPLPPENQGGQVVDPAEDGGLPQGGANRPSPYNVGKQGETGAESKSQLLARYKAQQSQMWAELQQCQAEMNRALQQRMIAAGNGTMVNNEPPCQQQLQQRTVQVAMLQTYISRLETGNPNITVCQANNNLKGCESMQLPSGSGSSSGSSSGSGGDPYAAVERSTRQGIRGNTMYTDSRGEQHELPTAPYYFEDMQTGQFIPSDSPNPPNNTHTYEQLTPEN